MQIEQIPTSSLIPYARNAHIDCDQCGKSFKRIPSIAKANKTNFCSRKCKHEFSQIKRACKYCDKEFIAPKSATSGKTNKAANFCSRPCYNSWLAEVRPKRTRPHKSVVARKQKIKNNPYCYQCGSEKRLEVHHIIPHRMTQDDSDDNLVVLCLGCHRRIEYITNDIVRKDIYDDVASYLVMASGLLERKMVVDIYRKHANKFVSYWRPSLLCAQS